MMYLKRHRGEDPETSIERIFDAMTRGWGMPMLSPTPMECDFAPALDVSENASEYRVRVELPGIDPKDVEVSMTGNVLSVRGDKKAELQEEGETFRRSERICGKFVRTLEFPTSVDAKRVEAASRHGVLLVRVPKAEESRPKTIQVKVE